MSAKDVGMAMCNWAIWEKPPLIGDSTCGASSKTGGVCWSESYSKPKMATLRENPGLKVKLLVGYIRQILLNSKGRLGNKANLRCAK